jgi:hypothetical protein
MLLEIRPVMSYFLQPVITVVTFKVKQNWLHLIAYRFLKLCVVLDLNCNLKGYEGNSIPQGVILQKIII